MIEEAERIETEHLQQEERLQEAEYVDRKKLIDFGNSLIKTSYPLLQ